MLGLRRLAVVSVICGAAVAVASARDVDAVRSAPDSAAPASLPAVEDLVIEQVGEEIVGRSPDDRLSFSLSADGSRVAVGSPGPASAVSRPNDHVGYVQVYVWDGSGWIQVGEDIDGGEAGILFGRSVSLSADGRRVAVAAPWNDGGVVQVYSWDGSAWVQTGGDIASASIGRYFVGTSVDLSASGDRLAVGIVGDSLTSNTDSVQVYAWEGGDWVQVGEDIEADTFGASVSMSPDGNHLADAHWVYSWGGGSWTQTGERIVGDATSMSLDGRRIAIHRRVPDDETGEYRSLADVDEWDGSGWVQIGDSWSGAGGSLSADGNRIATGDRASDAGEDVVGVRQWDGAGWVRIGETLAGLVDPQLSADGNRIAALTASGHVEVYEISVVVPTTTTLAPPTTTLAPPPTSTVVQATVPTSGVLPATGSPSTGATVLAAAVLMIGLALTAVARRRRT